MEMQVANTKVEIFEKEDDLIKLIARIRSRAKGLMTDITVAAMNAVHQSVAFGRTNYAQDLIDAVPSKEWRDRLIAFFQQNGRILVAKDKTSKKLVASYDKDKKDLPKPEDGKADEYIAKVQPEWTTARKARTITVKDKVDYVAQVDKFFAGIDRQHEKAKKARAEGTQVDENGLDFVRRVTEAIHGIKIEMGLATPEVEVTEPDADALAEENKQLKEQLAKLQGQAAPAEPKPEGHKSTRKIRQAA